MRLTLITFQLCVFGAVYLLVAVPVLAAVTGLVYFFATATEMAATASAMLGGASLIHYSLLSLGALPVTAQAPAVIAAGSSLAGAASTLLAIGTPLLVTAAVNLVLGFLAYYRGWYRAARRWGIVCNIVGLCLYLVPQAVAMKFALQPASQADGSQAAPLGLAIFMAVLFLLWDSFFIISLVLLYRMPEHPDIPRTVGRLPSMHMALWVLLALAWFFPFCLAGFPLNTATVVISGIILLAALPFAFNAKAVGKIVAGRGKVFTLSVFLVNIVLVLFCLLLLPPVGVGLLISATWLFFLVEMTFWPRRAEDAGETAPLAKA